MTSDELQLAPPFSQAAVPVSWLIACIGFFLAPYCFFYGAAGFGRPTNPDWLQFFVGHFGFWGLSAAAVALVGFRKTQLTVSQIGWLILLCLICAGGAIAIIPNQLISLLSTNSSAWARPELLFLYVTLVALTLFFALLSLPIAAIEISRSQLRQFLLVTLLNWALVFALSIFVFISALFLIGFLLCPLLIGASYMLFGFQIEKLLESDDAPSLVDGGSGNNS